MKPGRFSALIAATILCLALPAAATAGWWSGESDQWEKSGLDLQQGYDQNTVITLTGTIVSVDVAGDRGPAIAVMEAGGERVSLVLGPRDFWQKNGLPLQPGDQLKVSGSKAQGRDGKVYLMVQSLTRPGSESETTLRNRSGHPAWSGGIRPERTRPMPMRPVRSGKGP